MELGEFVQDLARGAGSILKDRYHTAKEVRQKTTRGDVVTEVDLASERYLLDRITSAYPEHRILSEESGAGGAADGDVAWVIDPLDGTRNYLVGIPFFCVSIGITRNGVPEIGAIYDPIHDELFFAESGRGAWLNGEPVRVCDEGTIEDGIVSVSWVNSKVDRTRFVEYVEEVSRDTSYFRRLGSAALVMAYVACGRIHGYVQGGLNPWDVAAGLAVVREAGGVVTDFQGRPVDLARKDIELVAGNPAIHEVLLNRVIRKGK